MIERYGVNHMKDFLQRTKGFLESGHGGTAVEYAVVLALVGMAAVGAAGGLGEKLRDLYFKIVEALPSGNG